MDAYNKGKIFDIINFYNTVVHMTWLKHSVTWQFGF